MEIILLLFGSYMLGNVLTGSIISKLFYRKEIRAEGSGNPGARNAGRLFGKKAFVATFLGDALKGVLAVLAAKWLGFGTVVELIALFAVTVGHIYPVLFKFRGGMGVSTFIGGILAFHPVVFAVFVGIFLILYPFIKSFTIAGMSAIALLPIVVLSFSLGVPTCIVTCFLSGLVLFAHREDLRERFFKERN